MRLHHIKPTAPGTDEKIDTATSELVTGVLRKGNLAGAHKIIQGVYGTKMHHGRHKGHVPAVQDRVSGSRGTNPAP